MATVPLGRPPDRNITTRQRETLEEIRCYMEDHGFPPTIKELAVILGIFHASTHERVTQLVRKGYLNREAKKARGITIVKKDP